MTTFNLAPLVDAVIAFKKGITLQQGRQFRDNPVAIAECDATAPVNQAEWHPYNKVTNGDANDGKFWDQAIDGTLAELITPDWVDGYEYAIILDRVGVASGTGNLNLDVYRETTAAYLGGMTAVAFNTNNRLTGRIEIYRPRIAATGHAVAAMLSVTATTGNVAGTITNTNPSPGYSTSQKLLRAKVVHSGGGNFNNGRAFLHRKRAIY